MSKPHSKRAWVVQELLLSPRTLYLCGDQLFWECSELNACETYPGGLPPRDQDDWMPREIVWQALRRSHHGGRSHGSDRPLAEQKSLRKLWNAIVRMYTGREMTVKSDRLIGLAGMAKVMGQALNDEYCAGLWLGNLAVELCWFPPGSRGLTPRPSCYCAPSWSWASLDGQCTPPFYPGDETTDKLIDIIEHRLETATDDPFGMVNAGTLRLCGWPATITLKHRQESTHEWSIFFNGSWFCHHNIYI